MTRIVIPLGYGLDFNVPGALGDRVRTRYAPLYRLWRPLESVAICSPFQAGDLLHSYNAVPLWWGKPWLVTFESRMPRVFSGNEWLGRLLRQRLLGGDCRAVIALSQWAARLFQHYNSDWDQLPVAERKLRVLHPTTPIRSREVRRLRRGETLRLAFVGNQFARKGGVAAVRLAKRAALAGIPLTIDIISGLRYGSSNHCDFRDSRAYADDIHLLKTLPNVRFYGARSNQFVLERLEQAHFTFLATLHETYGFSVIEGFSCGTPAITSNVCAQPEINDPSRGIILNLPLDDLNCWTGVEGYRSADYWDLVNPTYDSLAAQAFEAIQAIHENPETVEKLSVGAIEAAATRHNPANAAMVLNQIYAGALRSEYCYE